MNFTTGVCSALPSNCLTGGWTTYGITEEFHCYSCKNGYKVEYVSITYPTDLVGGESSSYIRRCVSGESMTGCLEIGPEGNCWTCSKGYITAALPAEYPHHSEKENIDIKLNTTCIKVKDTAPLPLNNTCLRKITESGSDDVCLLCNFKNGFYAVDGAITDSGFSSVCSNGEEKAAPPVTGGGEVIGAETQGSGNFLRILSFVPSLFFAWFSFFG